MVFKSIWIPDKRFREWQKKEVVTPEWFYQGSTVFKNQRKSKNVDAWLKISGMTDDVDSRLDFGNDGEREFLQKKKSEITTGNR